MLPLKRIAIAVDPSYNMSLSSVNMVKRLAYDMEKYNHVKYSVEDMKIMLHNIALYEEVKLFNGSEDKRRPSNYLASNFDIPKHILLFGGKKAA